MRHLCGVLHFDTESLQQTQQTFTVNIEALRTWRFVQVCGILRACHAANRSLGWLVALTGLVYPMLQEIGGITTWSLERHQT